MANDVCGRLICERIYKFGRPFSQVTEQSGKATEKQVGGFDLLPKGAFGQGIYQTQTDSALYNYQLLSFQQTAHLWSQQNSSDPCKIGNLLLKRLQKKHTQQKD